jgi:hypothetical protein
MGLKKVKCPHETPETIDQYKHNGFSVASGGRNFSTPTMATLNKL